MNINILLYHCIGLTRQKHQTVFIKNNRINVHDCNVPNRSVLKKELKKEVLMGFDKHSRLSAIFTRETTFMPSSLQKHAYSNILKILQPKKKTFQIKNSDIFHIFAQNIDCGYSLEPPRRGGSYEYPQSMFISKIRKLLYTPVNPSFTI